MTISEDEALVSLRLLTEELNQLRDRLKKGGFEDAGLWIMHVQDVLSDWFSITRIITTMCNETDLDQVPVQLRKFNDHMIFGVGPHANSHMRHLKKMLDAYFPEEDDEGDLDNGQDST